jgi:zinc transport system ATP-binding protein
VGRDILGHTSRRRGKGFNRTRLEFQILEEPARPASRSAEILTVSNLGVTIQGKKILEGVSFSVKRATTVAIIGPNGGGKTTLLKALLNLVPHSGNVKWNGPARIGYVPQTLVTTDIPVSVKEFLAFKSKTNLDACLNSVGLRMSILKQKLNTLSGGEMQRLMIAWAVIDKPDVLLFDEPTSSVDIGGEEPIYDMVNSLSHELGITVLLISHNMHITMHYADAVLALSRHVLFFGDPKMLSDPDLVGKIYGTGPLVLGHRDK